MVDVDDGRARDRRDAVEVVVDLHHVPVGVLVDALGEHSVERVERDDGEVASRVLADIMLDSLKRTTLTPEPRHAQVVVYGG